MDQQQHFDPNMQQHYQMQPGQQPMMQQGYPNQGFPQQGQFQQGYPQQGMPQQQMMMVQGNPINFMGAMEKLMAIPGVFVKQKFELLEAISGCETENKYVIYASDKDGDMKKKVPIFKAKEKSGFCSRQFLPGDCRPFKVKVEHEAKGASSTEGQDAFKFTREYACTYLCLNRPEMTVECVENGQNLVVGKVRSPFMCCDLGLDIHDAKGDIRWQIRGSCCQLGLFCQFPCEPCQTIDFEIRDMSGNPKGKLQKRTPGCLKAAISDADCFSLIFPTEASKEERALLVAAVIFLDFRYFEEKQNKQQSGMHIE